jgi:hypothetical protein
MRRATTASLKSVVERVEAAHAGYRALSIWPVLHEGPEGGVLLGNGEEEQYVNEPLR